MTINEISSYFDELDGTNHLVILRKDGIMKLSFHRVKGSDRILLYGDIFSSFELNSHICKSLLKEIEDNEELECKIVNDDTWKNYQRALNRLHIDKQLLSDEENNAKTLVKEFDVYGGSYVNLSGETGLLVGIVSSDEDYYYLAFDKHRKLRFSTCVGTIELAERISRDFSVLDYMIQNQSEELIEMINNILNETTDVLMTPICLKKNNTQA